MKSSHFLIFFEIFCLILYIQERYRLGLGTVQFVIECSTWEVEPLRGVESVSKA